MKNASIDRLKPGTVVKLTKLSAHNPKKFANFSNDYWVEGRLVAEPLIGDQLELKFYQDSDHNHWSWWLSSAVKSIIPVDSVFQLETANSTYRLEIAA